MRRALADIFAVACLVLFVAFTLMWVRSFAVADQFRHQDRAGYEGILSSRGSIALFNYDWSGFGVQLDEQGWAHKTGGPIDVPALELTRASHHRNLAGFWFFRDSRLPHLTDELLPGWCLVLPYWFFVLLFSLVPLGRVMRKRVKRRVVVQE